MKRILTLMICCCALFTSCTTTIDGIGPVVQLEKKIKPFKQIEIDVPANITLLMADTVNCIMSAQANIADEIQLINDGDKLIIKSDDSFQATKPIEIVISNPSLENILINGSGDLRTLNTIKGEELLITVNGSGDVNVGCEVIDLRTKINGSGDIKLRGKVNYHKLQINGSGNISSTELICNQTKALIKGSGDAIVNSGENLEVEIIGSGNVKYIGSPAIKSEITGSGQVIKFQN